jgi:acetyl-CoA acetyltransferase
LLLLISGADGAQVVELHDCFSTNELITYEGLGMCKEGEGEKLVEDEATTYGGRWVAQRPSRIATIPIGYADGVPRTDAMRARGYFDVRGRPAPVV